MSIHAFSFPTRMIFGVGALSRLAAAVAESGMTRPLVVTDTGVVRAGPVDRVLDALGGSCVPTVFDGVEPNPTEDNVTAGLERYRAASCDGVIAVGGGSPLDAGKIIALKTTHRRPLADYDDVRDGWRLIGPDIPPVIAIPTTAGTGSEVGRSGVITLKATGRKTVIFSPHLMPAIAMCDPELTRHLPAPITAATGADALTHCVEAYLATGYHPLCDAIALHGVTLANRYLLRAVKDGKTDMEARTQMMMAASMGATAFQKGLGVTHALAHPLSSIAGVHHGLANAILLPHTLRFNATAVPERIRDIGLAMDLDLGNADAETAAAATSARVEALFRAIDIPERLASVGAQASMLRALVAAAAEDGCHRSNPRPCREEDFRNLYMQAL